MHATNHLRDALIAASEARTLPQTIELDGVRVPTARVCGRLWNCTDIFPRRAAEALGLPAGASYAVAARSVKQRLAEAR